MKILNILEKTFVMLFLGCYILRLFHWGGAEILSFSACGFATVYYLICSYFLVNKRSPEDDLDKSSPHFLVRVFLSILSGLFLAICCLNVLFLFWYGNQNPIFMVVSGVVFIIVTAISWYAYYCGKSRNQFFRYRITGLFIFYLLNYLFFWV